MMPTYFCRITGWMSLGRAEHILSVWVYAAARKLLLSGGLQPIIRVLPRCQNHVITDLVSPAETYTAAHQLSAADKQ